MKQHSRALAVGRAFIGVLLIAAGIVFLVIPGPGLPVIVLGLALLAGMSTRLARLMDRAEPVVRRWIRAAKLHWQRASTPQKIAVIAGAVVLAGAFAYAMYRYWFA